MNDLQAVIFDLDGVLTDTAEYHYRAWKRLADEEGMPFDRRVNERLRGVGRRESLQIILADKPATEAAIAEMTDRKNAYYVDLLDEISAADLLPGARELLLGLRRAGIKTAIGSASKNTPTVLNRLGICDLLDTVVDGNMVTRSKPAPDVFLKAAELLDVAPGLCAVVEDGAAGVDAALAAGMWAVGLGPDERVGHAHVVFPDLSRVDVPELLTGLEDAAWTLRETRFDPAEMQHKETVFTTGNGNFCVRGNFEEGYPGANQASFMHRVWDDTPLAVTELANLPRWWGFDLWLNAVRVRMDQGTLLGFSRRLDMRTGVLTRSARWQAEGSDQVLDLLFERFVNLADPHQAVVRVRATLDSGEAVLRVRAGVDVHVENTGVAHWDVIEQSSDDGTASLLARTRATKSTLAVATRLDATGEGTSSLSDADGAPAVDRRLNLAAGQSLQITKYVAIVPELDAADPLTVARDIVESMVAGGDGWDRLRVANDRAWAKVWEDGDVVIDGDPEAQVAVRYNMFQLRIAAPRFTDRASIGAKTLSGFGYRQHVFWDTETFMLPLFTYTEPEVARNMLMYRWHGLVGAREKAVSNGYAGAQFPWESAETGYEVAPSWVAHYADPSHLVRIWTGDIEIHITADIAYAVQQYWRATGDDAFMCGYGAQIVLEGAAFWASAARMEDDGAYHFRHVIGPDEYHDQVDDNAFTNYMAQWHLRFALDLVAWLDDNASQRAEDLLAELGLNEAGISQWREVADRMFLPMDEVTGLVEQFHGYFSLEPVDLGVIRDPNRDQSMQQILGIEGCAKTQNIKQPDVLMLQFLLPDRFSDEQKRANFLYYDPKTDHEHGSSLGPSISAVLACEAGDPELGYQHFMRAARADLYDVRHNASDGIHGASAGGLWQAVVFGFGGLRLTEDGWLTRPMLPTSWQRLTFTFTHGGERHSVSVAR